MADDNEDTTTTSGEDTTEEISVSLIVEDGTCVTGANSYISLEDAVSYQTNLNRTEWLELDDNAKKASLIKATQYVDNLYNWKGRAKYIAQELSFPRVRISDKNGFDLSGTIPQKLKNAICEAAYYGYNTDLFSIRTSSDGSAIKKERNKDKSRVEGAVEKEVETEYEYFSSKESEAEYISKYAALDSILNGLYIPKGGKSVNNRVFWRG